MPSVSLYCKVHLPQALNRYSSGNIGSGAEYFNTVADEAAVNQLADACYLPANKLMLSLIENYKGEFRLAYSISGTTLELLMRYRPDVIKSFQLLAQTGCVEFLAETYYNSLSWLHSKKEFQYQVEKHAALIKNLFGVKAVVFRNTELIYNNDLAKYIAAMGYKGIISESVDRILNGRSANQIYTAPGVDNTRILLRNVSLSDDIAFRFGSVHWNEHPLTAEKYAGWIHDHKDECNINILLDYETFGIHKKQDSGIFDFLENLPAAILAGKNWKFTTPSEALEQCSPNDEYNIEETISWKDKEIECCVWCENTQQNNMLKKVYSLENMVHKNGNEAEISEWRQLQSADYFYHMSGERRTADDAYQYLNPFDSAEEAYQNYVNIITDFEIKLIEKGLSKFKDENQHTINTSLY
ncbi:MAG: glycoside hydrolase family 57 protein [Bacteroidota bacterium]